MDRPQLTEALAWNKAPDYLIRDRDGAYGHGVTLRLAAMGIRDHPIAPRQAKRRRSEKCNAHNPNPADTAVVVNFSVIVTVADPRSASLPP